MALLYIYVTIFAVYFLILTVGYCSSGKKVRDKYTPKDSNLCVVVYASGESKTVENLVKQLKAQVYPTDSYSIYVVLDKCENVSDLTLQTEKNVQVVKIDNLEPIGKSQAYSIIAEKLFDVQNLDAYVFLNANNYVNSDFLTNINYYLTRYDVFNPTVMYLPESDECTFWQNVKTVYSKYMYKFYYKTRTKLGLTNILNADAFVIKRDLLNKIAVFNFRNIVAEVEYTFKLAQEGVSVGLIDDLKVYSSINNFDYRISSLSKRWGLFFGQILNCKNNISREFLFSLIAPNCLTFILFYYFPLIHSHSFPSAISYSTVISTIALFLIVFCINMLKMNFMPKEYLYLFSYPLLALKNIIVNFPVLRWIRNIFNKTTHKHVIEKMTTNVIVTDGTREFQAQLELISDDGLAKVTFINPNGKKYTTKNNHLRMIDAVKELSAKLSDYGMSIRICQCCKYFQPVVDGSTNMVKGVCNCQFQGRTPGDIIPTLIWNTCPKFEQHNVVNLF